MSIVIQEIKRSKHLAEWAEMVRSCKEQRADSTRLVQGERVE